MGEISVINTVVDDQRTARIRNIISHIPELNGWFEASSKIKGGYEYEESYIQFSRKVSKLMLEKSLDSLWTGNRWDRTAGSGGPGINVKRSTGSRDFMPMYAIQYMRSTEKMAACPKATTPGFVQRETQLF